MAVRFNAGEAFEMAIRSEQHAAAFYRKAASQHANQRDCAFLMKMAAMEDAHEKIFSAMNKTLTAQSKESTAFDPDNEAALYLGAMVDGAGIEGAPKAARDLTGKESLGDILKIALQMEKSAVLFYEAVLGMVPEKLGRDRVQRIIEEEKKHIVTIVGEIRGMATKTA